MSGKQGPLGGAARPGESEVWRKRLSTLLLGASLEPGLSLQLFGDVSCTPGGVNPTLLLGDITWVPRVVPEETRRHLC